MPVKILVADDDKAMIGLYSRIFSNTEYSISLAETFAQASALIREQDFDLLITDFMFPDGVGTDLIKIFNEGKEHKKSLLVTGTPQALELLESKGMRDYIEKPFKVERFMELVNQALA